jgi:hypothetical protein
VGVLVEVGVAPPPQAGGRVLSQSGQPLPEPIASDPVVGKVTVVPPPSTNEK